MSLAIAYSRAPLGVNAEQVIVEVHLANGLPCLSIVGLPETAVKESKDRVRGALLNGNFEFPARRIIINLAPADLPKDGSRYDLPIALGLLAASGQIERQALRHYEFAGELALSGELRPIHGALPTALAARRDGRALIVPAQNADEAAIVTDTPVYGARHLLDVCAHLNGRQYLERHSPSAPDITDSGTTDLGEVHGQHHAKRALEIAAAGGHNLLLIGPPGTGKSMLASRLPGILPAMSEDEALESAAVYSISRRGFDAGRWRARPFRAPHHTASGVALVGGGSYPRPGEISLAHHGVMFLDELPEFDRRVLEVLREPLESGRITISRAARQAEFPARFQLIAAMNPCPCGYLGDPAGRCHCSADQVHRYRARVSGPLLDRIDMHIEVPNLPHHLLQRPDPHGETSAVVRARVERARAVQLSRGGTVNSHLGNRDVEQVCALDDAGQALMEQAAQRLGLSARAYHRILKVARTIADLAGSNDITAAHLGEALNCRCLDRRESL